MNFDRTNVLHNFGTATYLVFSLGLAIACYLRPSTEDFDRFVYEALIRSGKQPTEQIYSIVKHESPRAEASSVMDSPGHLAQLEPLYAIRPLYVQIARIFALKASPQQAINLISAASLFLISLLAFWFTENYLYSALLVATPAVVILGRMGGPDAFSTLVVTAGSLAILREKQFPGILLLVTSIWIRTDNVLFVLAIVSWLTWNQKIRTWHAAVLAILAVSSVEYINFFSGNYGWKVLLHYSFVGGRYPAEIKSGITLSQYLHAFITNAETLVPQLAPYILLSVVAWKIKSSSDRKILVPVFVAGIARYLLFPSGEARYFAWACVIAGLVFISSVQVRTKQFVIENRARAAAA